MLTVESILAALRTGNIYPAILALQALPASFEYPDACRLLARSSGQDRERLRVLLVDLLSLRPEKTWILPCVIHYRFATEGLVALPEIDTLDLPGEIQAAIWLPVRNAMARYPVGEGMIFSNRPQCVLLQLTSGARDEPPQVQTDWINGVFFGLPRGASVEVAFGPILSYAEGLEAGFLLNALVAPGRLDIPTTPRFFLQDPGWTAAINSGLSFRDHVLP